MTTEAAAPQQLSRSPSKWIEELEASPSLLTSPASSSIIYKGLSMATSPILQKRLYQIVKSHTAEMITCAAGCEILAGLIRYGTIKTAANVVKYIVDSTEFKSLSSVTASASSPSAKTGAKKKSSNAAAAAAATSATATINLDIINNFAPIISGLCFRVDVDPERNLILEPACSFVLAAIKQQLSSALILPADGGVTTMTIALAGEKSGAVGDKFVAGLVKDKAFLEYILQVSNQQDKNILGIVSKLIAAAKESTNENTKTSEDAAPVATVDLQKNRANILAAGIWESALSQFSADTNNIRMAFIIALLPHQKNMPVVNQIAKFVNTKRQDVLTQCLTSKAPTKSELAALLLNLAGEQEAKALAQTIINSVEDWPALVSKPQLPQVTLGCFMALHQVVQRERLVPNASTPATAEDMKLVLDSTTRHYLKQTLTAAESAKIAVKIRLSENKNNGCSSAEERKPKLLKVVDSSDDDEDDKKVTKTAKNNNNSNSSVNKTPVSKAAGTRRQREDETTTTGSKKAASASPKNSASAKKTGKK